MKRSNENDFKTSNVGHRLIIILRDRHHIDEDGLITGPVTDELGIRGYYQEWKRLMKANFKLTALLS